MRTLSPPHIPIPRSSNPFLSFPHTEQNPSKLQKAKPRVLHPLLNLRHRNNELAFTSIRRPLDVGFLEILAEQRTGITIPDLLAM